MTGQIPHVFIENLLARTDIVEVVGARVPLRRAGANFIACCPFHSEKTPSFTVNQAKQFYHCFGCQASGDAIRFLTEHDGLHFVEAVEVLASRAGLTVPTDGSENRPTVNHAPLYDILEKAALFYQAELRKNPTAEKAHHYLKNGGITGKIAKGFGLGFSSTSWDNLIKHLGENSDQIEMLFAAGLIVKKENGQCYDRFRDRIIFPIRDRRGRVVGFGGRIIGGEGEPKYLNSPETAVFNKRNELYGLYEAKLKNRSLTNIIVVEGYIDVVSLAQSEIRNVVATLGTALTERHLEALFRQASELVFCFDGDKAGQAAAKRALPLILPHIKEGRRVRFMHLPLGEDPDSFVRKEGKESFLNLVERAVHLSDFLFESLTSELDLHHLDSRAQLVSLAKPLIQLLPTGVFQQMLYDRLAELTGVSSETFFGRRGNQNQKIGSKKLSRTAQHLPPTTAIRAVAMLLKERSLIEKVGNISDFSAADTPGVELLCAIIAIFRLDSNISVEHIWAQLSSEKESHLTYEFFKQIADPIPEAGIEQEFLGAMQRLRDRAEEQAMESLLIKAKSGVLTSEEKVRLKNLLEQREKNRVD